MAYKDYCRDHNKYACYNSCPICGKKYDKHWKVVNHIRKTKGGAHLKYLNDQENEFIYVYENNLRCDLHNKLAESGNIFAGSSFAHASKILRKKYSKNQLQKIRKNRISQTMEGVSKTDEHNKKVANSVKKAWKRGAFDTKEVKMARQKGYDKRRSFSGKGNPMYGKECPKKAGKGKGGIRKDLGHYVRSTWEANICRVSILLKRTYQYEKTRFEVELDGSEYTYCPDLFFPKRNLYYEIKGHARSSQKWLCECVSCKKNKKIMDVVREKYGIRLIVIGKEEYDRFKRLFKNRIPEWEN